MKIISPCSAVIATLLSIGFAVADETVIQQAANETTVTILRFDAKNSELSPDLETVASSMASKEIVEAFSVPFEQIRKSLGDNTGYAAFDLPYGFALNGRIVAAESMAADRLKSMTQQAWPYTAGSVQRNGGWNRVQISTDKLVSESALGSLSEASKSLWTQAMEETADFPLQLIVVIPDVLKQTIEETNPVLPNFLGGGSADELIGGLKWLSVGFKPNEVTFRAVLQADSEEAAQVLRERVPAVLKSLMQEVSPDEVVAKMLTSVLGLVQPKVKGSQVVFSIEDPAQTRALLQLGIATLSTAAKPMAISRTQNKLKRLALGFHNYESAFRVFPTYAKTKSTGKPSGLSWRVHILPFLGEAELYREFKLDEPWDSEHNLKLLSRMPELYKPELPIGTTAKIEAFHTTLVAPLSEKSVFGQDKPVGFAQLTDGSSNTILFVEVTPENAIPWTSPAEFRIDPLAPSEGLQVLDGKASAAFVDGSVRSIHADEPAATWNALFSRNGGEIVELK
ncbi:MAG: DUF1559 domain-containing protein [Aureliella sp.]